MLPSLFEILRSSFADRQRRKQSYRYQTGVTFINQLNQRSYAAHTKKLDWQLVAEFEFNGGQFYGLNHDLKPF